MSAQDLSPAAKKTKLDGSANEEKLKKMIEKVKVVLLDIEGTITPITFVHDILFPYIRKHLSDYLDKHWKEAECQQDVEALRQLAAEDTKAGTPGAITIPAASDDSKERKNIIQAVIESVNWLMDADRKVTALKQLQGHMWKDGYVEGALMGQVYEDVVPILEQWKRARKDIYIYSSGSVGAQKLLFGYSTYGDLLYLFSGHFDTKIGMKVEADSYHKIAEEIKCQPEDILFLTDVVREAKPAEEAGLNVALVIRPGNAPLTDEDKQHYSTLTSFDVLQPDNEFMR
ncbi:enolase-phosphatase E1-like [Amphiura filiformis]|uniref:enolase-phosphatase E1-like n=1 Tax=Amphiura filiformis TaxID=82378 RepID=UPI003B213671